MNNGGGVTGGEYGILKNKELASLLLDELLSVCPYHV